MAESSKPKLSLDDAMELISDIARNGDGADRFRALKFVMSQQANTSGLPEPLSDKDIVDRLARLIRASGPTAAQLAYRQAFPAAKRSINASAPKVTESDIAPIDHHALPKNLRDLYRMFPEIKKPGVPKGYPMQAGLAVKAEWCRNEAKKMILDREQKRFDTIAAEAATQEILQND